MTNLIATLEGLTSPSREVDARIHYALFPDTEVLLDPGDMRTKRPGRRGPLSEMPIDGWADYDAICHHIGADRYTDSLDAATALVERVLPGWKWAVSTDYDRHHLEQPCHAHLMERILPHPDADYNDYSDGHGSNPAIALCIALIRALEARDGTE